jgi:hypothetical protein
MLAVVGTYKDGYVTFDREIQSGKAVRVIVTFLEEIEEEREESLKLSDFSFAKTKEILKNLKSSLADEIVEERRSELWKLIKLALILSQR